MPPILLRSRLWAILTLLILSSYVVVRMYLFTTTGAADVPPFVAVLPYLGLFVVSLGFRGRVSLGIALLIILFNIVTGTVAAGPATQPLDLRLAFNLTLLLLATAFGMSSDLNRKLSQVIQQKEQIEAELKRKNSELEGLARSDPLTALLNRRSFYHAAEEQFVLHQRYGTPVAMILLDLDHFKRINDTHGHAAGDQALVSVAQCLRALVRTSDVVARFGGEEFILLLPETEVESATQLAERLRDALHRMTIRFGSETLHISASLGVTTIQPTDAMVDSVLARVDQALYRAKAQGRNVVATL